jgi:hypothetical protein
MRRLLLPLVSAALAAAGTGVWAAGTDVLAAVTVQKVVDAVGVCAASQPEDVKEFACYKPEDGFVGVSTFAQVAVDLQFREIDKRVLQYLETLKQGKTAQPVDFAHSLLACFDPTYTGKIPPACADVPAGRTPRNFAQSFDAACKRSASLTVAAIDEWNRRQPDAVAVASDSDVASLLFGESRPGGQASCVMIAQKKMNAYKRVANLLSQGALQAGYDQARQEFVARISTEYVALLDKLQRMTSKLDLINDKWNQRTKNVYQP